MTKPASGTRVLLLTDVFSIIAIGAVTPAMTKPGNKEEISTTLTSFLALPRTSFSSTTFTTLEEASAMTAPV